MSDLVYHLKHYARATDACRAYMLETDMTTHVRKAHRHLMEQRLLHRMPCGRWIIADPDRADIEAELIRLDLAEASEGHLVKVQLLNSGVLIGGHSHGLEPSPEYSGMSPRTLYLHDETGNEHLVEPSLIHSIWCWDEETNDFQRLTLTADKIA